jgi:hypothetical protein
LGTPFLAEEQAEHETGRQRLPGRFPIDALLTAAVSGNGSSNLNADSP